MEKPERRGRKQCRSRTEDEAVIFEDFFATSLDMPPHPTLANILLKFQAQLHQLTPNAIAQLSNYFWAVGSFSGVPSGDAFVKWYELHYQPKKVETAEGCLFVQYDCSPAELCFAAAPTITDRSPRLASPPFRQHQPKVTVTSIQ
jgi:hypothetical protein